MNTVAPQISFDSGFLKSANALAPSDTQRVMKAIDRLCQDPSHPSLRLKPLHGDRGGRLHSIRAADDIRVLLTRVGNVYVVLRAGPRESIYDTVERGRWIVNPSTNFIGFVEAPDATGAEPDFARRVSANRDDREEGPGIFDHWGDVDLVEAGFTTLQIDQLRACRGEDELLELEWSDEAFDLACELIGQTPEQWRSPELIDDESEQEDLFRLAIQRFGGLHGISPLYDAAEIARIAAAPIEDWMIFLHPDQRAAVDRRYEGPARVRGSAGTGKTVVALHRAATLARRFADEEGGGRVLFTTFIKSLPPVFEHLYERLPLAVAGAVEFVNVDKLARSVCADVVTVPPEIDSAFAKAWRSVGKSSAVDRANLTRQYVRDEITHVIKGRGITSLDLYLGLERTGRRTRFGEPLRRQTWDIMEAWDQEMRARGTVDFCDVIVRARDNARRDSVPRYRAAILDEAQDITLVGLQFIRALVNGSGTDRSDGLLIVGDGAQRVYPGGFTLRQAGVEVAGRSTVLTTNYRNTAEIIDAAMAVAGTEQIDDLGDEYERGEAGADALRSSGFAPQLVVARDGDAEFEFLRATVEQLASGEGVGLGDIGVFAPTNHQVDDVLSRFRQAGISAMGLDKYDGRSTPAVKVGTFHRAKGLEFKVVFLPGLSANKFPRPPDANQDTAEYAEARSLAVSQLFVAMTRARDALFVLCVKEPSSVVEACLDHFSIVEIP